MERADRSAERITLLRDEPNYSPDGLSARSDAEYAGNEFIRIYVRCRTAFIEAQKR